MTEIAITVREVSLWFDIPSLSRAIRRRQPSRIQALHDIGFDVDRGETLGIIGRNGAGKSTLLRVLAGTLAPDSGSVRLDGRVSTLLALGSGFNQELSGRRNIVLGLLAAGLTHEEAGSLIDPVTEYAELEESIEWPLKTYSSGMAARLAFSISLALDPEILLVDEVFSVGDLAFREKSAATMNELIARSGSLVIVSHQLRTLSDVCTRVMWMDKGRVAAIGDPDEVIGEYQKAVRAGLT